ncbi:MAG: hypothetical protein JXB50_01885 [Spirochaetes bacterium]|nr:hypothetical protein [Spirochaetota bacterium]
MKNCIFIAVLFLIFLLSCCFVKNYRIVVSNETVDEIFQLISLNESLSDKYQTDEDLNLLTAVEELFCSELAKIAGNPENFLPDDEPDKNLNKSLLIKRLLEENLPSIDYKIIYEDYFQNNPACEKLSITGINEYQDIYKSLSNILIEGKKAKKENQLLEILSRQLINMTPASQKFLNIESYINDLSALLIKKDQPVNRYINKKNKNKPLFNFIPSLIYKPEVESLIAGGTDRLLKVFDQSLNEKEKSNNNGDESSHMAGITGLCWLNKELTEFASSSEDGFLRVWALKENKLIFRYRIFVSSHGINSISYHNGEIEIITAATPSGILYLQKKKDKFEVNSNWEFSQNRSIVTIASHTEGLIAGYEDGSIEIWQWPVDEKGGNINLKRRIRAKNKTDALMSTMALSNDGKLLSAGFKNGTLEIWEMKTNKILKSISSFHIGGVTAVLPGSIFNINGDKGFFLISGGLDHTLKAAFYKLEENENQIRWAEKENKDVNLLLDQHIQGGSITEINAFYNENELKIFTAQTGSVVRAETYKLRDAGNNIQLSMDKRSYIMTAENPEKAVKIINSILTEDQRTNLKIKSVIDKISSAVYHRFFFSSQNKSLGKPCLTSERFLKTMQLLKPLLNDVLKLYYASDSSKEVEIFSQKVKEDIPSFKLFTQIQPERDYLHIAAAGLPSEGFCVLEFSGDKWKVKRQCDIELKILFYDQSGNQSDSYVNYYKTCDFGLYLNDAVVFINDENNIQADPVKSSIVVKLEKLNQALHSLNLLNNIYVKKAKLNFNVKDKSLDLICDFNSYSLDEKYFSYSDHLQIDKCSDINDFKIWLENVNKKAINIIFAGYQELLKDKKGNPESFTFLLKNQAAGIEKIDRVSLVSEKPFLISLHCLLKSDVLLPVEIHIMPEDPEIMRIIADNKLIDNLITFQNIELFNFSLKKKISKENIKKIGSLKKSYRNKINPLIKETSAKCVDLYDYIDLFTKELLDNLFEISKKENLFESFIDRSEIESKITNELYNNLNELIFSGEKLTSGKIKIDIENSLKPVLKKEIFASSMMEAARFISLSIINESLSGREKLLKTIENSFFKSGLTTGKFINSNRSLLSKALLENIFEKQLERSYDEIQIMLARQSYFSSIKKLWDDAWIILKNSSDEINIELKPIIADIVMKLAGNDISCFEHEAIKLKVIFDNVISRSELLKKRKNFYQNDPLVSTVMGICMDVQSDLLARSWIDNLRKISKQYSLSVLSLTQGCDDKISLFMGERNKFSFYESLLSEILKIMSKSDQVLKKYYNPENEWQTTEINNVAASWPKEAQDLLQRTCSVIESQNLKKTDLVIMDSLKRKIIRNSESLTVSSIELIYDLQTMDKSSEKKFSLNERMNKIVENAMNINKFYNEKICGVIGNSNKKLKNYFDSSFYKSDSKGLIDEISLKFKFIDFYNGQFNLHLQIKPVCSETKHMIFDYPAGEELNFILNDGKKINYKNSINKFGRVIQFLSLYERIYASILKPLMEKEWSLRDMFIKDLKQRIIEKGEVLGAPIYEESTKPFALKTNKNKLIFTYQDALIFESDIEENIIKNPEDQNIFIKSLSENSSKWEEKIINDEFKKYYDSGLLNKLADSIKYIDKKELSIFGRKMIVRRENTDGVFNLTAQYNGDEKLPSFTIIQGINLHIKDGSLLPVMNLHDMKTEPSFDLLLSKMISNDADSVFIEKVDTDNGILELSYEYKPEYLNLHHSGYVKIFDIRNQNPYEEISMNILNNIADKFKRQSIIPELKGITLVNCIIDDSGRLNMILRLMGNYDQIYLRGYYSVNKGFEIYNVDNSEKILTGIFQKEINPYIKPSNIIADTKFVVEPCKKFNLAVLYKFIIPGINVPMNINIDMKTSGVIIDQWDFVSLTGWLSASPQSFKNTNVYFNDEKRMFFINTGLMTLSPGVIWQDMVFAEGTGEQAVKDNKLYLSGNLILKNNIRLAHAITGLNRYNLFFDSFIEEKKKIYSLQMNGPLQVHCRKGLPFMIFRSSLDYLGMTSEENMTHLDENYSGILQVHSEKPVPGTEISLQMNPDIKDNRFKINSVLKNTQDFSIIRLKAFSDRQKIVCQMHGVLTNITATFDHLPLLTTGNVIKTFLRYIKNSIEMPAHGDIQLGNHKVLVMKNKSYFQRNLDMIKEEFADEDIYIEEQKVKIFFGEWVPWEDPFEIIYLGKGTKFQKQREFLKIKMILKSGRELNKYLRKKIEFVYKSGLSESLFSTIMTPEQLFRNEVIYKKVGSLVLYYDKSMKMHVYKNNLYNSWEHVWSGNLEGTKDQRIFWEPLFYKESGHDFIVFHNKGSFFAIKNGAVVPAVINDSYNDADIKQIGKTYGMKKLFQDQRYVIADDGLPDELALAGAWIEGHLYFSEKPKIKSSRLIGNDYLLLNYPEGTLIDHKTGQMRIRMENILICRDSVYSISRIRGDEIFLSQPDKIEKTAKLVNANFNDIPVKGHIEKINSDTALIFTNEPERSGENYRLFIIQKNKLLETTWLYSTGKPENVEDLFFNRIRLSTWFEQNKGFISSRWFIDLKKYLEEHNENVLPVQLIVGAPRSSVTLDKFSGITDTDISVRLGVIYGNDNIKMQVIASDYPVTQPVYWTKIQNQFFGLKSRLIPLSDHVLIWDPTEYMKIVVNKSWLERNWKANPAGEFLTDN